MERKSRMKSSDWVTGFFWADCTFAGESLKLDNMTYLHSKNVLRFHYNLVKNVVKFWRKRTESRIKILSNWSICVYIFLNLKAKKNKNFWST